MIRQIISKIKLLLENWASKLEQIEQRLDVKHRLELKVVKHSKFFIPDWVLSIILVVVFVIVLIIKNLEYVTKEKLLLQVVSMLIIIVAVVKIIVSNFVAKIKKSLNIKDDEYKSEFNLFLTFTIFYLSILIGFKINNINLYFIPLNGFVILVALLLNIWWALGFVIINVLVINNFVFTISIKEISTFAHITLFFFISSIYILTLTEKIYSRHDILIAIIKSVMINFFILTFLSVVVYENIDKLFYLSIDSKIFTQETQFCFISYFIISIFNGVINWLIVTTLLSPLEIIYGRTTNIKLVELSNFNHPLLKRLLEEAPGTYQHSLIVSSLAENVAVELNANSLLCKVGGYFHDIGKIVHPEYFIENQTTTQNPHLEITPQLSALVIINHVKEGVKLAEEYHLDKSIIQIIQQHHGNSLIHGLYDKTLEFGFVNKEMLRYPGPKPQTLEAAIIMICDSCEAACRGIQEPDAQKIKETVEHVINSKFIEGQFDEVPLTLRDIYVISNIVTQRLISFYHLRKTEERLD